MTKHERLANQITIQLRRLGVSAHQDPCSGLMAKHKYSMVPNHPEITVIKIYDHHIDGAYDGTKLLNHLKKLKTGVTVDRVWLTIHKFKL